MHSYLGKYPRNQLCAKNVGEQGGSDSPLWLGILQVESDLQKISAPIFEKSDHKNHNGNCWVLTNFENLIPVVGAEHYKIWPNDI